VRAERATSRGKFVMGMRAAAAYADKQGEAIDVGRG
jgi:hypothetical protein